MWPVFASEDGNFDLFPFAKSGATCSNNLTSRPAPSVFESQLPTYFTEKANGSLAALKPEDTIYTLWIGTNDVGDGALLTGHGAPGVTVVDTVTCAVNWVQTLYNSGARNFIFQNVSHTRTHVNGRRSPRCSYSLQMVPLEMTPLYSANSYPNKYWTAQRNTTEWSVFMKELTTAGNAIARLQLQLLAPTLHGAHVGEPPIPLPHAHAARQVGVELRLWTHYMRLACRLLRLARPLHGHIRAPGALPQRDRPAQRHRRRARVRVRAEREHERPRGVHDRERD